MEVLIVDAEIKPSNRELNILQAEVWVRYTGQKAFEWLFSYYDDELNFQHSEFVGLTKEEGFQLFMKRDGQYLMS